MIDSMNYLLQYDILYAKVKIFRRSTIPGLARKRYNLVYMY